MYSELVFDFGIMRETQLYTNQINNAILIHCSGIAPSHSLRLDLRRRVRPTTAGPVRDL